MRLRNNFLFSTKTPVTPWMKTISAHIAGATPASRCAGATRAERLFEVMVAGLKG
jgi:hypothetical protein